MCNLLIKWFCKTFQVKDSSIRSKNAIVPACSLDGEFIVLQLA